MFENILRKWGDTYLYRVSNPGSTQRYTNKYFKKIPEKNLKNRSERGKI
jgi:hypothetical protein